jgi:hypothetical protein
VAGLHGFFRGIDQSEIANLHPWASQLASHLAKIALQPELEPFKLGPVRFQPDSKKTYAKRV